MPDYGEFNILGLHSNLDKYLLISDKVSKLQMNFRSIGYHLSLLLQSFRYNPLCFGSFSNFDLAFLHKKKANQMLQKCF